MLVIQVSNPRFNAANISLDDDTIGDAIQSAFDSDSEHAVLYWGATRFPIALSYKHDFGVIFEDWLQLLEWLESPSGNSLTIDWPSSTFAGVWTVSVVGETVSIKPRWVSVLGCPPLDVLEITLSLLRAELAEPVRIVATALSGHPGYGRINGILGRIKERGTMYR